MNGQADGTGKKLMIGRAVSLVWRSSRGLTVAGLSMTVFQGLLPLVPLYLMKLLIDSIEDVISGGGSFARTGLIIGAMGAAALLTAAVKAGAGLVEQAQSRMLTDYMQDMLHGKSTTLDLSYYEESSFYDSLHRAQQEAPYRPARILSDLVLAVRNTVSLLAVGGLLLSFHWAVGAVLVAAALPGVLVKLKYSRTIWRWRRKRTETERSSWYRHWLLTSVEHAKELRLFGLGEHFRHGYRRLRDLLRREIMAIAKRKAAADLATEAGATVLVYGSLAFIAWRTFRGLLTIGSMVMYFQAFRQGLGYLRELLSNFAGLYESNLFLCNLFDFLDMEPRLFSPASPEPFPDMKGEGLVLDDVCFRYPSAGSNALDHITLAVGPGETLGLVGENGSGKTTLVKLLCRLYDPCSGIISLGGIPLPEFDIDTLRRNITVVFQDYARYHLTAAENIGLGDIRRRPKEEDVLRAAETAGADAFISALPEGYSTVLGRWFRGGSELSAGEWQKIALARAFVRDAPIVLLDEPASALDARAEADLYRRFGRLAAGRTCIVISHRFSTVRMADRIAVMSGGRIVELGTHGELMALDGLYREMYTIQAGYYS